MGPARREPPRKLPLKSRATAQKNNQKKKREAVTAANGIRGLSDHIGKERQFVTRGAGRHTLDAGGLALDHKKIKPTVHGKVRLATK